jgi:hypothetical protein
LLVENLVDSLVGQVNAAGAHPPMRQLRCAHSRSLPPWTLFT